MNSTDNELSKVYKNVSFGNMVQVIGMKNIVIGEGSCICDNAWLNICQRDENVRMRIGKCVLVGRQSMLSTGGHLEIGDYCVFAPRVYISDADHVFDDITQPIMQQGATLDRSIIIEENCWFGINVVVTGNLTVGRCSIIGANAVVKKDVPPFCIVVGNPSRIVKMYNPITKKWEPTKNDDDVKKIMEIREIVPLPTRDEYKEILSRNSEITEIHPIIAGNGECI
jgi:acetyltransferase-like isoleucine patch superfamily enzyme